LNPLLKEVGFRIRYINFGRDPHAEPSLDGYHGLVLLGGPMSVNDTPHHPHLKTEIELVRKAIDRGLPILGICLGAQLIAKALGAHVQRSPETEIGWYDVEPTAAAADDPLLRHLQCPERIFQWHADAFDIPQGAVILARSAACENQAFRWGDKVYGLQFHLEVDEHLIERWLRVPVHQEELRRLNGKISPDAIRHETPSRIERTRQLSHAVFRSFVELFPLGPKKVMLRSR
jgi:GMP synthase (glutamine-hydrolysing)